MNKLFDIAHAEWERKTTIETDRLFLIDQRGTRQMSMTSEDMNYRHAVAKSQKRKQEQERRYQRHASVSAASASTVILTSDDSENELPIDLQVRNPTTSNQVSTSTKRSGK